MLDLTHVRSFIAVAEEMHFGRAAARLNLSQSPLSRQIQLLEQRMEVDLLERTTRAVRLTAAGQTFLREAYRVVAAAESAERLTRQVALGEAGQVHLGFTAASAYHVLPRLVAGIRASLPGIELVLKEMVTAEQLEALATRRLDLGLMRPFTFGPGDDAPIATVSLSRERLLLAVPRTHPLASGRRLELQDLDGQPFVTWAVGGGGYFVDLLATLLREGGVRPQVVQRVNQTHTMLALVGAGLGLALVPEAARGIRISGVTLRPITLPDTARAELLLGWRVGSENAALSAIRKQALEIFARGDVLNMRE